MNHSQIGILFKECMEKQKGDDDVLMMTKSKNLTDQDDLFN